MLCGYIPLCNYTLQPESHLQPYSTTGKCCTRGGENRWWSDSVINALACLCNVSEKAVFKTSWKRVVVVLKKLKVCRTTGCLAILCFASIIKHMSSEADKCTFPGGTETPTSRGRGGCSGLCMVTLMPASMFTVAP